MMRAPDLWPTHYATTRLVLLTRPILLSPSSTLIQTLTELDLSHNQIDEVGAIFLDRALKQNKVRQLTLLVSPSPSSTLSYVDTHHTSCRRQSNKRHSE